MAISSVFDAFDSVEDEAPSSSLGPRSVFVLESGAAGGGPFFPITLTLAPPSVSGAYFDHLYEVRVTGIRGKQLVTGDDGVATENLVDNVFSADDSGRAKMADAFFDATTTTKFVAGSITLDRLDDAVIQAGGAEVWTGDQDADGHRLAMAGAPASEDDLASKSYVDTTLAGLVGKRPVRLATTESLPSYTPSGSGDTKLLTANVDGVLSIDGEDVDVDDRLLVKDEGGGTSIHNGIYVVASPGDESSPFVLARAEDFALDDDVESGAFTFVEEGDVNADTGWFLITENPISVDVSDLTFSRFSGAGQVDAGAGLIKSGDTLDVQAGDGVIANANSVAVSYGAAPSLSTLTAGVAAAAGSQAATARTDHKHAVNTGTPVTIVPDSAGAEGSSANLARANHSHAVTTGSPVALGIADSSGTANSLVRSNHKHSAAYRRGDLALTPLATAGDGADTGLAITGNPARLGYVRVLVNGLGVSLGNASKSATCYFSVDDGATARPIGSITAGDILFWNGTVAGFDLEVTDVVSFEYERF